MPESSPRQNRFSDYLELLKVLNERGSEALVVGGQAVNFWAELFEDEEPEIRKYRPFTSVDLDLHRPDSSAREVLRIRAGGVQRERDPFGKAFTIVSHTFLIESKEGRVLPVDSLKIVSGLRPTELKKGSLTVEFDGVNVLVLNPIACLKAKLHNLRTIDQQGRQDEKHARILIRCVRAFIRQLLNEAKRGNCRPALNALEQMVHFTSRAEVLRTAHAHGFDLAQAIPLSDLIRSEEPKIFRFATHRLPQWQRLISPIE